MTSMSPELPVSAPGSMSSRTDMGPTQAPMQLPNAAYGEQQQFQDIQGGAPMAAGPMVPPPTSLTAPSQAPMEPLTAGIPMGPGANAPTDRMDMMREDNLMLQKYLPQLEQMAAGDGVPKSFQLFVRHLRGAR